MPVQQPPQGPAPMSMEPPSDIEMQQPAQQAAMSTEEVTMRGGEEAACDCCCFGCSEQCC
ncbi:hypothetical protein BP6252_01326 [Coleophoma cylindrospora]|uniref:Uncharacterized protein n=1 Tax=Coleophoma cylindrospora TaxID=1849047 RepID=A0A3D8SSS9_9HELO|nr:hypothetical protein BP6252_01326 [Coleophoma cylindrospora]